MLDEVTEIEKDGSGRWRLSRSVYAGRMGWGQVGGEQWVVCVETGIQDNDDGRPESGESDDH